VSSDTKKSNKGTSLQNQSFGSETKITNVLHTNYKIVAYITTFILNG